MIAEEGERHARRSILRRRYDFRSKSSPAVVLKAPDEGLERDEGNRAGDTRWVTDIRLVRAPGPRLPIPKLE